MKRIFTLLIALMIINFNSFAQLAPNSIAPDFTAEDINGVEHNLYDLLDEGKTVILDVFAIWCPPCWSYHNTHALKDVFTEFGPDGTNEMYVFGIEGDASTNVDCLYDLSTCNGNSMGDWVDGVPYPYIDSRDIAQAYGIEYFPTIFMVYPNRLVSEIGQLDKEEITALQDLAPTLTEGLNPAVIKSKNISTSVCSNFWPVEPTYLLSNLGTETLYSGTISIYRNGKSILSKAWKGEAKPFNIIEEVRVPSDILSETSVYEVKFENINGTGEHMTLHTDQVSFETENAVEISIQLDNNAVDHKNRYQILDADGNVLHERIMDQNGMLYTNRHTVPSTGCHTFVIFDEEGDGINGNISVTDQVGNFIFGTSDFEEEGRSDFNVGMVTGIEDVIEAASLTLTPNPVRELLELTFYLENTEDLKISITDLQGKKVLENGFTTYPKGTSSVSLDVNLLVKGFYFVMIENNEGVLTQKFVKQ